MELQMPKTADDDMPGTRGASVVWHPLQNKYYAAMAGNKDYPLAIFDIKAKRLSPDSLTCLADIRGLWYNPVTKQINGNAYGENGWFAYKLNKAGMVKSDSILLTGLNQPSEQSVGSYHPVEKYVLFLQGSKVYCYDKYGMTDYSVMIHWGKKKSEGADEDEDTDLEPDGYNNKTVIYTGIKNAELGFLNKAENRVELYSYADGFLTKKMNLPDDAPAEPSFNFAFANGIYWLFNMEMRKWTGYK